MWLAKRILCQRSHIIKYSPSAQPLLLYSLPPFLFSAECVLVPANELGDMGVFDLLALVNINCSEKHVPATADRIWLILGS